MTVAGDARQAGLERSLLTVTTDFRQLDVRVPFDVPVIELMPEFEDLLLTEAQHDRADFWTLTTRLGRPIDLTRSLAQIGVLEGDSLRLVIPTAHGAPPVLSDVVEEVSATTGRRWSRATRRATLLFFVDVWLTVLAVVSAVLAPGGNRTVALMCAGVAGAFTLLAIIIARARIDVGAAGVLALGTLPLWAVAGANFTPLSLRTAPLEVTGTAMAVVLLALVVQIIGIPRVTTSIAGAALFVVIVELGVVLTHLADRGLMLAAASTTAVFAFLLSFLPRLSAHLSGLTSVARPELGPDSSVRIRGEDGEAIDNSPDPGMVAAKVDQARQILLSLQFGTMLGLICGWAVLINGDVWTRWLVVVSALIPVLRARRHHQLGEIVGLMATSAIGVVASLAALMTASGDRLSSLITSGIIVGVLGALVLYGALLDVRKTDMNTVTMARLADKLEILVRVALLPLALSATGLFGNFLHFMTRVGGSFHI